MNVTCLDLAKVYSVLLAKHNMYVRRITLTIDHLRGDREILSEFKTKEIDIYPAAMRRVRQIHSMERGMRRWKRRLEQIDRLKVPIEKALASKTVAGPTESEVVRLWPKWMDKDGKTKPMVCGGITR